MTPLFGRLFAGALTLTALTGCYERFNDIERYGVFELTDHMVANKLDWEGGNTSLVSSTLCMTLDGSCFTSERIRISTPIFTGNRYGRIAIHRRHTTADDYFDTLGFHDATTGRRLTCSNCDPATVLAIEGDDAHGAAEFFWGRTDQLGIVHLQEGPDLVRIVMLEFSGEHYRVSTIATAPVAHFTKMSLSISPDERAIAWYACDSTCTLYSFDRNRSALLATDVPCPYNSYLDIGWLDNHGFAQHYWGATKANMCFTSDGRPALPRGKSPDDWHPEEIGEPELPTSVDQLPPTYSPVAQKARALTRPD